MFTRIDAGFCPQVGSTRPTRTGDEGTSLLAAVLKGVRDIQLETPEGLLQELQYLRANRRSMDVNEWNVRSAVADRALMKLGGKLVNESDIEAHDPSKGDKQPSDVRGHLGQSEVGK